MTIADVEALKAARELISEPSRWTKGVYAKNLAGMMALSDFSDAVCFCSLGAIRKVVGLDDLAAEGIFNTSGVSYLVNAMGDRIVDFNDTKTHRMVLAAFDAAIAEAKRKGE